MSESPSIAMSIITLLAIAERVPIPFDEAVEAHLAELDLIAPNKAMILDLTERGRIWLDMLRDTPLPIEVPVPRYVDPRKAAPADTWGLKAQDGRTLLVGAPQAPDAMAPTFTLPPGFEANAFTDLPPGQTPGIFQRDTEIEVVWRNGKRVKNYAGAVIFLTRNKPDDTMGYRVIPQA